MTPSDGPDPFGWPLVGLLVFFLHEFSFAGLSIDRQIICEAMRRILVGVTEDANLKSA